MVLATHERGFDSLVETQGPETLAVFHAERAFGIARRTFADRVDDERAEYILVYHVTDLSW